MENEFGFHSLKQSRRLLVQWVHWLRKLTGENGANRENPLFSLFAPVQFKRGAVPRRLSACHCSATHPVLVLLPMSGAGYFGLNRGPTVPMIALATQAVIIPKGRLTSSR